MRLARGKVKGKAGKEEEEDGDETRHHDWVQLRRPMCGSRSGRGKDMGTIADILALGHFEGERKRMVLSKVFCKKRKHILCTFYALTLKVLHSGLKGSFVAVKWSDANCSSKYIKISKGKKWEWEVKGYVWWVHFLIWYNFWQKLGSNAVTFDGGTHFIWSKRLGMCRNTFLNDQDVALSVFFLY